jgi:glycosyltransferase involved in cell wall biosynthesis
MRVVYIYDGEWPRGATRVRKETAALASAGHDVLLLARNRDGAPSTQSEEWMEVRLLPVPPGGALRGMMSFPFFLNPVWIIHIVRQVRDWGADMLIVEDLPLAPTALWVGRRFDIPVFYDMGEVYPEFLRGMWQAGRPTLIDRIVRNPSAAGVLERYVLKRAAHTFVVSEESRARAIRRGARPAQLTIVGNTPEDPETLAMERPPPPALSAYNDRPIVLFTGILIFDRGIIDAVRAIDRVRRAAPEVMFVIVGDGPAMPEIQREIDRLEVRDHVLLVGWKDHALLPGFYKRASVGLLPFLNTGQIRYTLANKLFDYMGAGLPIIASDVPPMRRVITETQSGLLVPPEDPEALAAAIIAVLQLPEEERQRMGDRGRRAVRDTYNWKVDSERMVDAVARQVRTPADAVL